MKAVKYALSCAFALGLASGSALAQSPIVLTTAHWLPPTHHLIQNVTEPWAKQLEERTEGRVRLRTLPTSPMPPADYFDGIRNGVIDIGFTAHGYTPGRFVLSGIAELPFLGDTAEAMSVAYQRVYEKHLAAADEHRGLVTLAVFAHGPGQMFTARHPVTSLRDLEGLKWRVGGGVVNDAAKLLNTTAFLRPPGETYELISSGIADGVFFPADTMVTFRLADIIRHATIIPGGFYNTSFAFVMNRRAFDRLSEADQKILLELSGEHYARMAGQSWDGGDKRGLEALEKANASIIVADDTMVEGLKTALSPLEEQWIKAAAQKGVDGAAALADFRAELKSLQAE